MQDPPVNEPMKESKSTLDSDLWLNTSI
jgi:hypothetical protein